MKPVDRRSFVHPGHFIRRLGHRLSIKVAAAIVGVAALVLVCAGGMSLWLVLGAQMRTVTALHQLQAATAAERILRFVDELESHLRWLIAPSWSSTNEDDRRIDALRTLRALAPVSTLRLLDPQGQEQLRVSRLGPDVAASGADFGRTDAYRAARRQGRHVGPVYFQDGSEPYVTIHLGGASARQGSVVADVNLKLIWDIVAASHIGEAGRMLLVDDAGRLISHPDISLVLRRADVSALPQVQAALASSPSGDGTSLVAGRDLEGQKILSAHARLPSLGWSVVTELPRAEVLAPVYASIRLSIVALLGGLTAAIVCGVLIARHMIRPIETLTAGAARIGAGALDHRITIAGSDEFAELGERFNEMAGSLQAERATLENKVAQRTQELARANQAKSRFLASASHDLRQPLHALSLFVDELHANPTRERRARLNDKLAEAVDSLNGMFDAILDTSKIEADAIKPALSRFPVAPLCDALRVLFAPAASAKGLELEIGSSGLWIESDALLLQRILQNLMANAIRYTDKGRVALSCSDHDGQLTIAVTDNGPGIPTEMQSDIFGEFFRAPTPGQSGERGLGLGLFIVASFARLLNHTIGLDSAPGRGSTFAIRVPIVSPVAEPLPAGGLQRHASFGQGRHAAVLGDDPAARDAATGLLRSWGFDVREAASPAELESAPVDLLIADADGIAAGGVIATITAIRVLRPALRIVLLTGQTGAIQPREACADIDMLRKPVLPIALRAAVTKAMAGPAGP
ncbi:ATP-binding protein [Bosea psychrotolerans]|uniref:histidine kinase n=1 Tax=Bosea psychrotolerans TaxID=1871628 RepID=A0A2S4MEA7_9HYPH|nr:ATP-binding protein [Bosea psychrotolerans]POR53086.1 signal transduction histidine kinase [Bosea psychrotolerans]